LLQPCFKLDAKARDLHDLESEGPWAVEAERSEASIKRPEGF